MGFLDALMGRSKPVRPDLDALFSLPSAAVTLQAALDLTPTGTGAVCFKAAEGGAFASTQREVQELLDIGEGPKVEQVRDEFGYTWLVCRAAEVETLVTDLHAVNSALEGASFGPALLCSVVAFAGDVSGSRRTMGIVYLYKRGTFYPFAPTGGQKRDNQLELQVRGALGADLKVEPDLTRWFPVWGAPGL